MNKKRIFISIFWVVLGTVLVICNQAGLVEDYWCSMGVAFIVVGLLQILRHIRYMTNSDYRENRDIETSDERNKFIANKAWAWAGYLYVILAAIGSIVCKLLGREDLMMFCSGSVCFIILVYWLCWLWLRRKY